MSVIAHLLIGGVDRASAFVTELAQFVPNQRRKAFYTQEGLTSAARRMKPNGVFALWRAVKPKDEFVSTMREVFDDVCVEPISYIDPCLNTELEHYIVTGRTGTNHR